MCSAHIRYASLAFHVRVQGVLPSSPGITAPAACSPSQLLPESSVIACSSPSHSTMLLSPHIHTGAHVDSRRGSRGSLLVTTAVKAKSARQVCCSKTVVARPEQTEAVQQLCKQLTQFSQQQMANRSNGIHEFTCAADGWDQNVFHFWERYESNTAMGRHNTRPEVVKFMEQVTPLLERPVGMALYEYRDGKIGAVGIQGGPKGEGGLDDATGASGAAGGASYKQTSRAAQLTSLKEDDLGSTAGSSQTSASGAAAGGGREGAWWAFAGSPAAAVGLLVGAAAGFAVAGLKLTGH
eukprot:GHUV01003958.1.p1 GENE.GHUV01003958.1~~GHUV01003958.1.p1  ORF type:complete len:295 (+),score=70.14 GHUV01003958.1:34-918(+)